LGREEFEGWLCRFTRNKVGMRDSFSICHCGKPEANDKLKMKNEKWKMKNDPLLC
jgi:hypothetical protein